MVFLHVTHPLSRDEVLFSAKTTDSVDEVAKFVEMWKLYPQHHYCVEPWRKSSTSSSEFPVYAPTFDNWQLLALSEMKMSKLLCHGLVMLKQLHCRLDGSSTPQRTGSRMGIATKMHRSTSRLNRDRSSSGIGTSHS